MNWISCLRQVLLAMAVVTSMAAGNADGAVITAWTGVDYFDPGTKGSGNRWYRGQAASGAAISTDWAVDIDGDNNTDDDQLSYYEFSLTEPLNPLSAAQLPGARYRTHMPSAIFYGGIVARYGNTRSKPFTQMTIEDELDVNKITSVAYMTEWDTGWEEPLVDDLVSYNAVFIWQKEGFLNGGDEFPVSFDATGVMSMQLRRNIDLWRGIGEMRWLVRDGDQFYLAEDQLIKESKWGLEFNSIVPTQTNWAPYSPSGPIGIDFDQNTAIFTSQAFTDVTAVGFYHERDVPSNDSDHLKLFDFHVEGTLAVPTPATGVTAFWVAAWIGAMRREHRR